MQTCVCVCMKNRLLEVFNVENGQIHVSINGTVDEKNGKNVSQMVWSSFSIEIIKTLCITIHNSKQKGNMQTHCQIFSSSFIHILFLSPSFSLFYLHLFRKCVCVYVWNSDPYYRKQSIYMRKNLSYATANAYVCVQIYLYFTYFGKLAKYRLCFSRRTSSVKRE